MAGVTPVRTPASKRGRVTRAALVRAARDVFERDGFPDARISDIAARAGVAIGSFYTYFADKDALLVAVLEEAEDPDRHPALGQRAEDPDARLICPACELRVT